MLISPPLLLPRSDGESFEDWVQRCLPKDEARKYPINNVGTWHGGDHILHTGTGIRGDDICAIADGEVIHAIQDSGAYNIPPLNYNGKTNNGCVVMRHKVPVGEHGVNIVFYSVIMHLKEVYMDILSGIGHKFRRGHPVGISGYVDGGNGFHFQICCSYDMLFSLCGRMTGDIDISIDGNHMAKFGSKFYYVPHNTSVYSFDAKKNSYYPDCTLSESLYIKDDGSKTQTFRKSSSHYFHLVGEVALNVRSITEPHSEHRSKGNYSEFVRIAIQGGDVWVDINSNSIRHYSDYDMPDWDCWLIVDDDKTEDSQCNSTMINFIKASGRNELLNKTVCLFPFEWDATTFDVRFSWLKNSSELLPSPMNDNNYKLFHQHIISLGIDVSEQQEFKMSMWHFDPITFIQHIQKGERKLLFETKASMNDFSADDLHYGDMSREEILALGKDSVFGDTILEKEISSHENELILWMKEMAFVTAWGEYSELINLMVDRFLKGEGGIFRHELLNKAFAEHKTTNECINKIKQYIQQQLSQSGMSFISHDDIIAISNNIRREVKLPKFDNYDWFNGLGITVHDTYATKIYLDELNLLNGKFYGVINFQIQDHFGLNKDDIGGKVFKYFEWFCSWFILQRYVKYGYKPFISEANFTIEIEGDIS